MTCGLLPAGVPWLYGVLVLGPLEPDLASCGRGEAVSLKDAPEPRDVHVVSRVIVPQDLGELLGNLLGVRECGGHAAYGFQEG